MNAIPGMTIGVQQLGLMEAGDSFEARLDAARRSGYEAIELLNVQRRPLEMSAEQVSDALEEAGIAPIATHVNLDQLESEFETITSFQRGIGCNRLVVPWVATEMEFVEDAAAWSSIGKRFSDIGRRCIDAGIRLGFHNHVSELLDRDGREGLFRLFDECGDDELFWEADIGHIAAAHVQLGHLLSELGDRCELAHVRNMIPDVFEKPVLELAQEHPTDFSSYAAPIIERIQWESALDSGAIDVKDSVAKLMEAGVEALIVEFHHYGPGVVNGHAELTRIIEELSGNSLTAEHT